MSADDLRVVLADDAGLWREGIARLLTDAGMSVVAQVADADTLRTVVVKERPDIAICDVRMPPTFTDDGLRAALWIREHAIGVATLVLSQNVHAQPAAELMAGARGGVGYLLKERVASAQELVAIVRRVADGGKVVDPTVAERLIQRQAAPGGILTTLTERERDVLALMAEGRSNAAIADRLFLSPKTVEAHIRSMLTKLRISSLPDDNRRVHAVLTYLRAGA